jgi:hypothetical protein
LIGRPPTLDLDGLADWVRDLGCPGCETRWRRSLPVGARAGVWYDTAVRSWVVALPCVVHARAILSLDIRWFHAPMALVQFAAAGAACAAEDRLDPDSSRESNGARDRRQAVSELLSQPSRARGTAAC